MLRVAVLCVLMLTGCAQMLNPGEDALPPRDLPVELQSAEPQSTKFAVEAGAGSVTVQDRTITGICHKQENHGAYLEGSTVTFWIAHTGWTEGAACPRVGRLGAYRATIQNLKPGSYLFRVQYMGEINTDSYPRPVLEQQVTVK